MILIIVDAFLSNTDIVNIVKYEDLGSNYI